MTPRWHASQLVVLTIYLLVVLPLAQVPSAHALQTKLPYRAQVQESNAGADVRSGPGKVHYATDQLKPGSWVEIYRHDPGGWLAIRPPQGSFSLVQSDDVDDIGNGLLRVNKTGARAWVGTRLSAVDNPMWQIQLEQGELLELLGTVDRETYQLENEQPDWFQIAPPAGEFRWMHRDDLDLSSAQPISLDSDSNPTAIDADTAEYSSSSHGLENGSISDTAVSESWEDNKSWADTEDAMHGARANRHPLRAESTSNEPSTSGWRPATRSINTLVDERSRFIAEPSVEHIADSSWQADADYRAQLTNARSPVFDDAPGTTQTPSTTLQTSGAVGVAEVPQPVQTLELRLTQELLRPPTDWQLGEIAQQVQQLKNQPGIDVRMETATNRLLEKIRKCREIQAGYRAVDGGALGASAQPALSTDRAIGSSVGPVAGESSLYSLYDAHGWLNELVRDGGTGPTTYVLQDTDGKITYHIAAPPGLNLRRYLHQEVGIVGNRGFHQQLNLNHVTAERVIALDRIRR